MEEEEEKEEDAHIVPYLFKCFLEDFKILHPIYCKAVVNYVDLYEEVAVM